MRDELADEHFGCRSARGNAQCLHAIQPGKIDIFGALDKPGYGARALGDFDEAKRIGAVGRTDDEQHVTASSNRLDRCLPVRRGVTDILTLRADNPWKTALQRCDDIRRIIDRQRGLREESKIAAIGHLQIFGILDGFHQRHRALGHLAKCTDHFGVATMADKDDVAAGLYLSFGLAMHLGNQWAGGVEIG